MSKNRQLYILIYNMKLMVNPIRFIAVDTSVPFKLKEFKKSFYSVNTKLNGDKFLIFKTLQKLKEKENELIKIYDRKVLKHEKIGNS